MAEAAGLAIGAIGLAGLFTTSVECIDLISLGRNHGRDYEILMTKILLLRARLSAWGGSLLVTQQGKENAALRQHWGKEHSGITRDQHPFILLTSPPSSTQISLLASYIPSPFLLFPIPDEWLIFFSQLKLRAYFKEEDSDYMFNKHKLESYPGRYLSKKRNLVKQFHTHYNIRQEKLQPIYQTQALNLLNQWQEEQLLDKAQTDYSSCYEAILLLETLQLEGYVWLIKEQVVGLTIGELLTPDCFAIHFFKGLKQFKGLYQVMYQNLALMLSSSIQWINLEQDLGSAGLRQSKQSYLPDALLIKWRVPFEKEK